MMIGETCEVLKMIDEIGSGSFLF